MLALRTLTADDWRLWRELRLAALAESPGAFGAKLEDWQGRYDSEPRWRARLQAVPLNLIAILDELPVGMTSGAPHDGTVELISMWVSPRVRGQGVGDALIAAVVAWASSQGSRPLVLRVYEHSQHAVRLYLRNGFLRTGRVNHRSSHAEVEWTMARPLQPAEE